MRRADSASEAGNTAVERGNLIYPWRKEPDALMFVCIDRGKPLIASCGKCGEECPDYSEQVQPL